MIRWHVTVFSIKLREKIAYPMVVRLVPLAR
jgi:hypothetical protein